MLTIPLGAVRGAIGPGGALEALGVGTAQISVKDDKRLRRVRLILGAATGYMAMVGLLLMVTGVMVATLSDIDAAMAGITLLVIFVLLITVLPVTVGGFLTSMYTGSCLCRNAVITQIHTVRFADLVNDESKRNEVLALQDTVKLLSQGWGRGLLGFVGFFWGIALACLFICFNGPLLAGFDAIVGVNGLWRPAMMAMTASCSLVPVLMAKDVATTSSTCDVLMDEINRTRQRLGPEANEVITWLESSLKNLVRLPQISLLRFAALRRAHALCRIAGKGSAS